MEKYFNWLSFAVGAFGGPVAGLLGGWDMLLKAIVVLMVLDYITGLLKGVYTKTLSSEIGFRGLLKKVMVLIVIVAANVLQGLVGGAVPLREVVIMFFIANEGLSLLENAAVMVAVPDQLRDVLLQVREKNNKEEGE